MKAEESKREAGDDNWLHWFGGTLPPPSYRWIWFAAAVLLVVAGIVTAMLTL